MEQITKIKYVDFFPLPCLIQKPSKSTLAPSLLPPEALFWNLHNNQKQKLKNKQINNSC